VTGTAGAKEAPIAPEEAAAPDAVESSGRWLELQEAAVSLISERGYHGTTMKHVASALGVQAPSLYNHVVSKQEILQRIMIGGMQRLVGYQDEALASSEGPRDQLRAMTEAHVLLHIRHRRSAMVGDRELGNLEEPTQSAVRAQRDTYERRFRAVIQQGVDEGVFSVASVKLASFAIIEMATSVTVWFNEGGPLGPNEVASEYGEMALRIVGAKAAKKPSARSSKPQVLSAPGA
jgi:AcrR family transcriptional regulator